MSTPGSDATDGSLDGGVAAFTATQRRRGLSPNTIRTYGWSLDYFIEFLAVRQVYDFEDLRREHVEAWQDQLVERELAAKTRSIAHTAVRQFLLWAADRELVDWRLTRAIVMVRTQRRRPRPIPHPHLIRILAAIGPLRPSMTVRELRDRALFIVLLVSGARISEALQLTREDFADAEQPIVLRQKGGTEKELLITPTAREWVLDYLRRRRDRLPQLWVTTGRGLGQPLSREMVTRIWRNLALRVGVPRWTSHQLRHSSASELKRGQVGDLVVADHLGHSNLATLANYAAVVDVHRDQKVEVLEGVVSLGLDAASAEGVRYRRPAKVRGRPDNRRRRGKVV